MRRSILLALSAVTAACYTSSVVDQGPPPGPPANLNYELLPSGDPSAPIGVLLRWDPPTSGIVAAYVVYSRSVNLGSWVRRATTTSASFYDLGLPDLQYMVTASDAAGLESIGSNIVTVDPNPVLIAPTGLTSISLNGAVELSWDPNARLAAPTLFAYYRVYSTLYDLDNNLCQADWVLEGTTVSEDFISSGLTNGVPLCFAVSAVSTDGHESVWSGARADTPRFDARNVLINTIQFAIPTSGFLFYDPSSQLFGVVTSGTRTDIDFNVDRHGDGTMWLQPVRTGTSVVAVGPVSDLTAIDFAPATGYGTAEVSAVTGNGYVFQTQQPDGPHFGGVRVTAMSTTWVIVDWSYQTDHGNPELSRVRPTKARP